MNKYDYIFLLGLFVALFFLLWNNKDGSVVIEHSIDTVYSKPDTVLLPDTVFIPKLHAVLDTVYLEDSTQIISSAADTTLVKDSSRISVKYFFPPLNFFDIHLDIRERTITKVKTITEYKKVYRPEPFYKDEWFWSSAVLIFLLLTSIVGAN